VPNANLTSITPILKEMYEGPIAENVQNETVLTQRIVTSNKGVTQKAGGKYVDFPVLVGRNQGIAFRQENEDLGEPGRARMKEVNVPLFYGYARARLQGQLFELANNNTQSFVDAIDNEMVVTHMGVFNPWDDTKVALNKICCYAQDLGKFFAEDACKEQLAALASQNEKMREALKPFAHEDLSRIFGGNCSGEDSIVFQRSNAILKIRDFSRARELLGGEG